jgi:hypothetical protein
MIAVEICRLLQAIAAMDKVGAFGNDVGFPERILGLDILGTLIA